MSNEILVLKSEEYPIGSRGDAFWTYSGTRVYYYSIFWNYCESI